MSRCQVQRILRISRVVSDLGRAEAFYRDGLGFRTIAHGPLDPATTTTLDAGAAYYQYFQNSFGKTNCSNISAATCSGTLDAVSFDVDWKFAKKFDLYGGMMYSQVHNGLAAGYLHNSNFSPTVGLRFRF